MFALNCSHVSKCFIVRNGHNGTKNAQQSEGPGYHRFKWLGSKFTRSRSEFFAVRDVSFSVKEGEIFGIIGENGSGKSTLIRMIATLLVPSSGSIEVFGHDVVQQHKQVRRLINRVSVEASFFKKLSARENLSFACRLYDVDRQHFREQTETLLAKLKFPLSKLDASMEELSRGMQQKVAIVRALLTSPVLLLLDEPTTGLDPRSRLEVQDCINEVRRMQHATVILTTHDMKEAEQLCDRIAFIDAGRIIALDTPEKLKSGLTDPCEESISLENVFLRLSGRGYDYGKSDTDSS